MNVSAESVHSLLTRVGLSVAKSYLVVLQLDQAAVADGNPENIGCQVFQGCAAIAHRFAVHDPLLLPDLGGNLA